MKKRNGQLALIIVLVLISLALYATHLLVFKDLQHVTIFALGDLAFVPIEVICVTLIFHRVLANNERKKKVSKLYMVIATFYSEVGTELLRAFANNDVALKQIEGEIAITLDWKDKDFKRLTKIISGFRPQIEMDGADFEAIDMMLQEVRPELLRLLENPSLLEHETFTELLMAVFHLAEELRMRYDFASMRTPDHDHLVGDVKRAYVHMGLEWLNYINHMRVHYPYLYSLSVRNNPFKPTRDVQIKE